MRWRAMRRGGSGVASSGPATGDDTVWATAGGTKAGSKSAASATGKIPNFIIRPSYPSLRAKRSNPAPRRRLDCFVASLLAMTL
jgi:hypothetical protein